MRAAHDQPDELEALRRGEDQQRTPGERAVEGLLHRNELGLAAALHEPGGLLPGHDADAGTDRWTCSPTICRRLLAARLTPILAISASASRSTVGQLACVIFIRRLLETQRRPGQECRECVVGQRLRNETGV